MHRMLTPDLLHEVELGVWKSLLSHLIRMLYTCGPHSVTVFDTRCVKLGIYSLILLTLHSLRFREITTYPPDTIRKFRHKTSAMKRFAARDFEDVLQVSVYRCAR